MAKTQGYSPENSPFGEHSPRGPGITVLSDENICREYLAYSYETRTKAEHDLESPHENPYKCKKILILAVCINE